MLASMSDSVKTVINRWQPQAVFFFCALVVVGFFTSRFMRVLPSIGLIGLTCIALFQKDIWMKFSELAKQKAFLAFIGLFLMHLLTFVYTDPDNFGAYWEGIILKVPLLLLPLAFGLLPGISYRKLYLLYYLFFLCVSVAALYSLVHYFFHYDFINESYIRSKVMPTWVNHVRYSLMVAFAIFIGCRLLQKNIYFYYKAERFFIAFATCILFVFIHLLAVRSGLVALYGVIGVGVLYVLLVQKKFILGLVLGVSLLLIPLISYFTLPTFYNKFHNTVADVNKVEEGGNASTANNYSLAGRVYSYKVGMLLIQEHPLLGVGVGNFFDELDQTYNQNFPEILESSHLIPHSQFLFVIVLLGIIGFVLFLIFFFYPFFAYFRRADILFSVQYLVVATSFFTEATLETQVGLLFSVLFILLPIFQLKYKEASVGNK